MGSCRANSLLSIASGLPAEIFEGLLSVKEQGKRGRLCVNKFCPFSYEPTFSQPSV